MIDDHIVVTDEMVQAAWQSYNLALSVAGSMNNAMRSAIAAALAEHRRATTVNAKPVPTPPDFSDASKWRTRDGRKFRIYSTDGGAPFPIHGAVLDGFGWSMRSWTRSGLALYGNETDYDLIPAPPERKRRTVWLNIYPDIVGLHGSLAHARTWQANGCECRRKIEIEYTLGEGLDGADEGVMVGAQ